MHLGAVDDRRLSAPRIPGVARVALGVAPFLVVTLWFGGRAILGLGGDGGSTPPREALQFDTTVPSEVVAVLPPVPPSTGATAPPAVTPAPSVGALPPATVTTGAPVAATAIQTVPAVRDVIVDIGGRAFATDQFGRIELAGVDPNAAVTIVGAQTDPPIQQVVILGWADGSGDAARPLGALPGPVAYLALALKSRVSVVLESPAGDRVAVDFDTEGGPVRVPIGTATWLLDQRAVRGGDGLIVEQLHYTARWITTRDGPTATAVQVFLATPEARWLIADPAG